MTENLRYLALSRTDIPELEGALRNEPVYEFIGAVPSKEDFSRDLVSAMRGPNAEQTGEVWINFVVRKQHDGELLGRLEATVHDGIAEVAFLYKPSCWGLGYASRGLSWLHQHLRGVGGISSLWGATHPENIRSAKVFQRHGYHRVDAGEAPKLYSYDPGDLIFRFEMM